MEQDVYYMSDDEVSLSGERPLIYLLWVPLLVGLLGHSTTISGPARVYYVRGSDGKGLKATRRKR